jgi:2-oxoglutarate dehydrogenase E2 component (dihydrolipoamide succinyltransferase)
MRARVAASYTVFVVAAVARALRRFPYLNSELRGEDIVLKNRIHVGVAVSLEETLVVPVLKDAGGKTLLELGAELESLAAAARGDGLDPQAMAGGTFTVTNSGVYGSLLFTPIINYPQAATLGMGKVADTVVVRDGGLFVRPVMYLCLSYDHRIVDGAMAVRFLQEVKGILERPEGVLG